MGRTTVTLPAHLVRQLIDLTGRRTKTAAVRLAVEEEIRRRRLERLRKAVGTLQFDLTAEETRHGDHRLG